MIIFLNIYMFCHSSVITLLCFGILLSLFCLMYISVFGNILVSCRFRFFFLIFPILKKEWTNKLVHLHVINKKTMEYSYTVQIHAQRMLMILLFFHAPLAKQRMIKEQRKNSKEQRRELFMLLFSDKDD